MSGIMAVYEFIKANGGAIVMGLGAIVILASVIAKLTPTPKDDEIVGKIKTGFLAVLDFFKIGYPKFDDVWNKDKK